MSFIKKYLIKFSYASPNIIKELRAELREGMEAKYMAHGLVSHIPAGIMAVTTWAAAQFLFKLPAAVAVLLAVVAGSIYLAIDFCFNKFYVKGRTSASALVFRYFVAILMGLLVGEVGAAYVNSGIVKNQANIIQEQKAGELKDQLTNRKVLPLQEEISRLQHQHDSVIAGKQKQINRHTAAIDSQKSTVSEYRKAWQQENAGVETTVGEITTTGKYGTGIASEALKQNIEQEKQELSRLQKRLLPQIDSLRSDINEAERMYAPTIDSLKSRLASHRADIEREANRITDQPVNTPGQLHRALWSAAIDKPVQILPYLVFLMALFLVFDVLPLSIKTASTSDPVDDRMRNITDEYRDEQEIRSQVYSEKAEERIAMEVEAQTQVDISKARLAAEREQDQHMVEDYLNRVELANKYAKTFDTQLNEFRSMTKKLDLDKVLRRELIGEMVTKFEKKIKILCRTSLNDRRKNEEPASEDYFRSKEA